MICHSLRSPSDVITGRAFGGPAVSGEMVGSDRRSRAENQEVLRLRSVTPDPEDTGHEDTRTQRRLLAGQMSGGCVCVCVSVCVFDLSGLGMLSFLSLTYKGIQRIINLSASDFDVLSECHTQHLLLCVCSRGVCLLYSCPTRPFSGASFTSEPSHTS